MLKKINLFFLKRICLKHKIPIIRDSTAKLINKLITKNHFHSMLEIGTAYGYSSCYFSTNKFIKQIDTLEKNKFNFTFAFNWIKKFSFKKINPILIDAFDYKPNKIYDLIFIDGCKSNQEILFNKYKKYLSINGYIIIDNLFLKKIRNLPFYKRTKNQQKLIDKLDKFINFLENQIEFDFKLIDIDDGVGVLKLKYGNITEKNI